ncbi:MAG: hypothetical protein RMJ37_03750 [Spirochaetia bacterium]|nr:hypothetical protein [Spirochaetota bacterium]MCX8096917.1 hypothetical protein [Spirochaetota bacterium]MDW8112442.1 hypothetical protein [Spirochaetia bacterium]
MRKLLVVFSIISFITVLGFSQPKGNVKISEQQDVSIFASYYTWDIPPNIVNKLDDGIVNLFSTMKRFNVKGFEFRFSEGNLEKFMARVAELQQQKITKAEKFVDPKWGTITLTPDMLERLVNSYTIVVPNIKTFGAELRYEGFESFYVVTLGLSLKFFDPAEGKIFHVIDITKTVSGRSSQLIEMITGIRGRNLTREETIVMAVDEVLQEIKYQLRGVEKFKLYTTIVDTSGGKLYTELGRNFDITPGLELDIVETKTLTIGGKTRTVREVTGLVRVVDAKEDYSEVIPIFGDPKLGVQLTDSLRRGLIFRLFFGLQQIDYAPPQDPYLISYFEDKWNRLRDGNAFVLGISGIDDGSFAFFEPQVDISLVFASPFTLTLDILFNYSIYLRNFKIKPYVGIDLLGSFTYLGSIGWWWYYLDFYLTTFSLGFTGGLTLELLFSKYVGLSVNAGYKYTIPVYNWIRAYDTFGNEFDSSIFTSSMIPDFGLRGLGGSLSLVVRF